jgi:hypothetical protein
MPQAAGTIEPPPELVRRLALYLRANPHAGDTEEGIAQWWLGIEPSSMVLLERALGWFENHGLLETVRIADGRVHYRRVALNASVDERLDRLIGGNTSPRYDG